MVNKQNIEYDYTQEERHVIFMIDSTSFYASIECVENDYRERGKKE
ncbi:hypothetical protein IAP91_16050 [Leuconostoc mesenteroides]|nr:hypothetical protein [Leuconostoc mesenteroides]